MEAVSGLVFNIQRFSIHDGPGIRTTVFFKGCPLECLWCHNPESQAPGPALLLSPGRCIRCGACVAACPEGVASMGGTTLTPGPPAPPRARGLESPSEGEGRTKGGRCRVCGACVEVCQAEAREMAGRTMTAAQVLVEVERDRAFYDESGGGVTASGGEPLRQPDFLLAVLRGCRELEIHTALDTCGYAAWEVLDRVRPYVDLFLYDLKAVDDARHRRLTGVSNEPIVRNLRALAQRGHAIALRLPVIPGLNDDDEEMRRTAELAASLPGLQRVHLLPYHPHATTKYERLGRAYRLPDIASPSADRMADIAAIFERRGLDVRIGG